MGQEAPLSAKANGVPSKADTRPSADLRRGAFSMSNKSAGGLSLGQSVSARRTYLRLPETLPLASWRRIGQQINLISNSSQWWLADWLIYGQEKFPDRYKQAIAETSLEYQTLRNYVWVARRFSVSRRRDTLSFQHHAEVASLPEADQTLWLDRAEHFHWSLSEFRKRLKCEHANAMERNTAITVTLKLNIPPDKKRRWQAVAAANQLELSDWVVAVIDQATEQIS
jgi:hypothetical protein